MATETGGVRLALERRVRLGCRYRRLAVSAGVCRVDGMIDPAYKNEAACVNADGVWEEDAQRSAPYESTKVYVVPLKTWGRVYATEQREVDVMLPSGHWLEWPVGWLATGRETADANWEAMSCDFLLDDMVGGEIQTVPLAEALRWREQPLTIDTPAGLRAGVLAGPVLYLPPLAAPRLAAVTFNFDQDVNDGWSVHPAGSSHTYAARLFPAR